MDDIAKYNKERWEELSKEGIGYSIPWMELTDETAYRAINREGVEIEIAGKDVLCLAASGGQQSAAFGILGARVTVLDLTERQLAKDRATADHYGLSIQTIQGDMRDLSVLESRSFDVVWLAHGINFVPDARKVIAESVRVLRPAGFFRIHFTNPYAHAVWDRWNGEGYLVTEPFEDGSEVSDPDPFWEFKAPDGTRKSVKGPHEFRHSLTTIVNTMISLGMRVIGVWEEEGGDPNAKPGSWNHFQSRMPPWITIWATRERLDFRSTAAVL